MSEELLILLLSPTGLTSHSNSYNMRGRGEVSGASNLTNVNVFISSILKY